MYEAKSKAAGRFHGRYGNIPYAAGPRRFVRAFPLRRAGLRRGSLTTRPATGTGNARESTSEKQQKIESNGTVNESKRRIKWIQQKRRRNVNFAPEAG